MGFNCTKTVVALAILLAASLCMPTHVALPPPQRNYRYTQQMLTLSWPGTFCDNRNCNRNWMSRWNGYVDYYVGNHLSFMAYGPTVRTQDSSRWLVLPVTIRSATRTTPSTLAGTINQQSSGSTRCGLTWFKTTSGATNGRSMAHAIWSCSTIGSTEVWE